MSNSGSVFFLLFPKGTKENPCYEHVAEEVTKPHRVSGMFVVAL